MIRGKQVNSKWITVGFPVDCLWVFLWIARRLRGSFGFMRCQSL
ncbi:hypothetical protein F4555_002041 [Mobiluncus mulieris]|nr:hypothetical protein [Mobiluncus mulieris]MBB5847245.1 hypothetical protein [Mobiluncus mulieris]